MKKLFCFALALLMIISLSACANNGKNNNSDSVDVDYFAKLGQMPECEYSLGDSASKVEEELSKQYESSDVEEMVFSVTDMEDKVLIDNGTFKYYYSKADSTNAISYIVNFNTAFGFEVGTLSVEIEKALSDYDYKTEKISKEKVFFLFGNPVGSVITCEFGENTVMFVFENNALCATALFKTSVW